MTAEGGDPGSGGPPRVPDPPRAEGPLRILVLNWQDRENPQAGGAETHLHEIFGRLAARGHEVVALVSGWDDAPARAELDGIEVHRAGGRYTFSLAGPWYYLRHLAGRDFDVVVEDLNKVPLFAPLWVSAPVVPLVHHLFGATAFQEANPLLAGMTWLLERPIPWIFADRPGVAVSESTREDLVNRGLDRRALEVIPNGIDADAYTPSWASGEERYAEPTLLYLGRLKRYKGVDLIVRALARLRERGEDVPRLVVAGSGDHAAELEALARELGVSDRVELLGFVSEEKKLELFRRAWLHVLTSPKEGWGIANMEAAASGTPTVASDSPGLRESVRAGETGLLVPHGDVDALAGALATLLDDRERIEEMGRAARRFAEAYSWDASTDALEALLRRVVASRKAG